MNNSKKIKEYIKNNELDLEVIINEYSAYIGTIIDNMTKSILFNEDKEEICSDVFFILWKNTKKLDINKKLSSYIAGVTRNVVKEYLKKKKNVYDISDYENVLYSDNQLMTSLYKNEQEAREKYDSYKGAYGGTTEKINENEIKFYITATGNSKSFPSSKKLFVSFNKIRQRYWENNEPKYIIYNGEWSFEIDVSSKMAKTNLIEYKMTSISDNSYKFESAVLSNTSFKIKLNNCNGITYNENECVETSDGIKYYPSHRFDGDGEISVNNDGTIRYYNTFNLTSFNY